MSVDLVRVSSEVIASCLCHALTTEKLEIMGLLVGAYEEEREGCTVATIRHSIVLTRKDKLPDRVEVGYENLACASSVADALSCTYRQNLNVVGWYHR
jgi:proteasome lid subunit RPN8/RPN11